MEEAGIHRPRGAQFGALGWVLGWGLCEAGPDVSHMYLKRLLSPLLSSSHYFLSPAPRGHCLRLMWTSLAGLAEGPYSPPPAWVPTHWHRTLRDLDGTGPCILSRCHVQWAVSVGWEPCEPGGKNPGPYPSRDSLMEH